MPKSARWRRERYPAPSTFFLAFESLGPFSTLYPVFLHSSSPFADLPRHNIPTLLLARARARPRMRFSIWAIASDDPLSSCRPRASQLCRVCLFSVLGMVYTTIAEASFFSLDSDIPSSTSCTSSFVTTAPPHMCLLLSSFLCLLSYLSRSHMEIIRVLTLRYAGRMKNHVIIRWMHVGGGMRRLEGDGFWMFHQFTRATYRNLADCDSSARLYWSFYHFAILSFLLSALYILEWISTS
ncbi:hypothetical protein R3P38DRAFT_3602309 [Favolaschia claudopus]|uniref:Uncharacterized protein n=1 Tax=Favolaschia claudopus TaxID=2862362 RepID=A0AAW0ABU5_9AGAR